MPSLSTGPAPRQAVRHTADVLHRHNCIDASDHGAITAIVRDAVSFESLLRKWYAESGVDPAHREELAAHRIDYPEVLDQVFSLAMRPFLARSAEVPVAGR